jgi:hypothetical protein
MDTLCCRPAASITLLEYSTLQSGCCNAAYHISHCVLLTGPGMQSLHNVQKALQACSMTHCMLCDLESSHLECMK